MNAPLTVVYLRAVGRLNRRARSAIADRDHALETVVLLRDDVAMLERDRDAWKRRAEALYDACSPGVRDGVLGCIDVIERLPEVQG